MQLALASPLPGARHPALASAVGHAVGCLAARGPAYPPARPRHILGSVVRCSAAGRSVGGTARAVTCAPGGAQPQTTAAFGARCSTISESKTFGSVSAFGGGGEGDGGEGDGGEGDGGDGGAKFTRKVVSLPLLQLLHLCQSPAMQRLFAFALKPA